MWMHITYLNDSTPGVILGLHLHPPALYSYAELTGSVGFTSLWASCDDSTNVNNLGGSASVGGTVAYGTLSSNNAFVTTASAAVPQHDPPLVLSGLLSEPVLCVVAS